MKRNDEKTQEHEKPFQCPNCDKCFKFKYVLNRHILVHSSVKAFICNICQKQFTLHTTLKAHNKAKHTDFKPYHCKTCGSSFKSSSVLINHEKKHTGEKRHKCRFCEKKFIQSNSLKTHERIHTGESRMSVKSVELDLLRVVP